MRYFDSTTKTELIPGMHDMTNAVELPDDHWFFTLDHVPQGKMIAVDEKGWPILVDVPQVK